MQRVDPCNPLWIITCCGCIPILGLMQGIIVLAPCLLYVVIPTTITNIFMLPCDIVYLYYYICQTRMYGPNLKFFAMIFALIPIALYLPLSLLVIVTGTVLLSIFGPMVIICQDSQNICVGGIAEVMKISTDFIQNNYEIHSEFPSYLQRKLMNDCENPFDISIFRIIYYIIVGSFGIIVMTLCSIIYGAINLIPMMIKLFLDLNQIYCNQKDAGCVCLCFFPYLIAIPFCPVLAVLGYVGLILYCIGIGSYNVQITHEIGLKNGLIYPFSAFKGIQRDINQYVYEDNQLNFFICCDCILTDPKVKDELQAKRKDQLAENDDTLYRNDDYERQNSIIYDRNDSQQNSLLKEDKIDDAYLQKQQDHAKQ